MKSSGIQLTGSNKKKISQIVAIYEDKESAIVPILNSVQETAGYISDKAIVELSEFTGITQKRFHEVINSTEIFNRLPLPKKTISVCSGISCSMKEGREIYDGLEEHFLKDQTVFLKKSKCFGICDKAPSLRVNDQFHGNITLEFGIRLLEEL